MSSSEVNQDNLLFPSEVDLLRGRRAGVHSSEEVCVFSSLMGNTLYRKKGERGQEWSHQTKGVPAWGGGGLIIIPASAM